MSDIKHTPSSTSPVAAPSAEIPLTNFADAFAMHKDAIAAVPEDSFLFINVDITAVVTMICGAWPHIVALRAELATLPEFDAAVFDDTLGYALALGHTQAVYQGSNPAVGTLPARAAEGAKMRELMLDEVKLLGKRGLVDVAFLETFRGGGGYRSIAFELLTLVTVLHAIPADSGVRLHVSPAELLAAETLSRAITQELGEREQAPVIAAAAARARQQAFTLAAGAYDAARRGVVYLRWLHGDADEFAPSLYAGRGRRRTQDDADAGTTPVATDTPRAPSAGATPVVPATPRIEIGMPGSDPFRS